MSVFEEMVSFLDNAWLAKDMIVPCLIGPPGIGKTAAVREHAKNVGADKVVTIIASQILPNEVSGITMPVPETKAMEIFDHYRLSSLKDGDILFFDELLEADQLVLSACLAPIESRQMMSGKSLPDIQIVAATNPTIVPSMIRENIRQRFMFRKFDIDRDGTADYIRKMYGFDIEEVKAFICSTSDNYNTITPRTMTKLAAWIASKNSVDIANDINLCFDSTIGTELYKKCWMRSEEKQALDSIREACYGLPLTKEQIVSIDELGSIYSVIEYLKEIGYWNIVEKALNDMPAPAKQEVGEVVC